MSALGGSATGEIAAPIDAVWATVSAVETMAEWQNGVVAVRPLERDAAGDVVRAEIVTDAKVKQLTVTARFTREAPTRLSWTVESGDIKRLDGSWDLVALDGERTQATYTTDVDPGRMLAMLVRGAVADAVHDRLVAQRPAELAVRVAAARQA